ncbi:MAG: S8 family serine peptidase [bacterium]|nr:S8 family serine peptidase [bacterium]
MHRSVLPTFFFAFVLLLPTFTTAQTFDYPHEAALVEVMFLQESWVRLDGPVLLDQSGMNAVDGVEPLVLAAGGGEWTRLCAEVPEPEVDQWAVTASANLEEPVYNLNNIYRLRLTGGGDAALVAADLQALPGVQLAYPVALPPELPLPPSYVSNQGYLATAASTPTGVDAQYAWTLTGGDGTGVTVCDIEYSWNYSHEDVTKAVGSQLNTNNVGDPFTDDNHGTAVIGELVANDNGWGVTGVAKGAGLATCGCYYGTPTRSWNVAGAIGLAVAALSAGDVILLEQQWDYTGSNGYVPVEWYPATTPASQSYGSIYAAIQNAVGNGIIVVEAAGNGGQNLDLMTWYGDSGAIIVGAGGAYPGGTFTNGDLQKLSFSSYGTRVDVQGWGENVYTTGYGDLFSTEGKNRWFTSTFNGTSSASPVVAGAVACLQGWYLQAATGTPLTPAVVRSTLIATGTAQITPPAGNIGPRPDLAAAIAAIPVAPPLWVDVTAGFLADATGQGKGIVWGDYDRDGDPDIYFTNTQSQCFLLQNNISNFTNATLAPVDNLAFAMEPMWGDFDNDGLLDLHVGNWGLPNAVFHNQGLHFVNGPLGPINDPADGTGTQWVDVNNDGKLDVYVTGMNGTLHHLYAGDGMGGFFDVTQPPLDIPQDAWDSAWGDFDNDGDQDCYLVCAGMPNLLARNDGNFMFTDITTPVVADANNGVGACVADANGDGNLDIYLTNFGQPNRLLAGDGMGGFVDVTTPTVALTTNTWGAAWGDYDNDGDPDLYVGDATGANKLLRNDGAWAWTDDTNGPLGDTGTGSACAFADYDLDGDLDLYVVNQGTSNRLFRNDINNGNNWLHIDLVGGYSNAAAIGARVRIVAGGVTQIREIGDEAGHCAENSLRVEFGLGSATWVDSVTVIWPSPLTTDSLGVAAGGVITIAEPIPSAAGDDDTPRVFAVDGAFPNPFNPETEIRFAVPRDAQVGVDVYDAAGRRVRRLPPAPFAAGRHGVTWRGVDDEGRPVPSGVYFARVHWEGGAEVSKLALVK